MPDYEKGVIKELIEIAMEAVEEVLPRDKSFIPFVVTFSPDEEFALEAIEEEDASEDADSDIAELRSFLNESIALGESVAALLAYDITLKKPGSEEEINAVCLEIKFVGRYETKFIYPYKIRHGKLDLLEPLEQFAENLF